MKQAFHQISKKSQQPLLWELEQCFNLRANPLIYEMIDKTETILSAATLWGLALQRHHVWRKNGVKPGDMVFDESTGFNQIIVLLASIIHQCTYVPVQPGRFDEEIELIHKKVAYWHTDNKRSIVMFRAREELPENNHVWNLGVFSTSNYFAGETFYLFREDQILVHLKRFKQLFDIKVCSSRLCLLPGYSAYGIVFDLLLGLFSGQNIYIYQAHKSYYSRLKYWFKNIEFDFLTVVPKMIPMITASLPKDPHRNRSISLLSLGAAIPRAVRESAEKNFKAVHEGYGRLASGLVNLLDGEVFGCQARLEKNSHALSKIFFKSDLFPIATKVAEKGDEDYYFFGDLGVQDEEGKITPFLIDGDSFYDTRAQLIKVGDLNKILKSRFALSDANLSFDVKAKNWLLKTDASLTTKKQQLIVDFVESHTGNTCQLKSTTKSLSHKKAV